AICRMQRDTNLSTQPALSPSSQRAVSLKKTKDYFFANAALLHARFLPLHIAQFLHRLIKQHFLRLLLPLLPTPATSCFMRIVETGKKKKNLSQRGILSRCRPGVGVK